MYKCWVLSESNIQVHFVVYWFTFYDQNIQGSCDNAFSVLRSTFCIHIQPVLYRSTALSSGWGIRRSVSQKPGYDGS